jgi:AAA family ATP:ADP antiporter
MAPQDPPFARLLSRALRPFARVEAGEAITTVIVTSTLFLLLTAYYFLKTAREPLILLGGGAEVKSYAAAGQALLLVLFVRAYGAVAKRVGRVKLLATVFLFFASNLVVFAGLVHARMAVGVPFYLWVGVFNYASIAQLWAFAADIYTPEQGKRLFAILGIGSSVGAVAGARIARSIVSFGPRGLMLAAAAILVVCVGLIGWADRRTRSERTTRDTTHAEEPLGTHQSVFALLLRDKYLLLIAALMLVLNWVNSNGEYLLDRTLLATLARQGANVDAAAFIGRFKADYFAWVNLVGVLLQLFAVSRVIDKLGVRASLYLLPVVAFAGYGLMIAAPILALIRLAKIAENSLDYSIQNTARQTLYLVATRAEKFVGKTVVDTFFVRVGDVFSAGLVWLGSRWALATPTFAAINLGLILVWVVILVGIGEEHRRRSRDEKPAVAVATTRPSMRSGVARVVSAVESAAP